MAVQSWMGLVAVLLLVASPCASAAVSEQDVVVLNKDTFDETIKALPFLLSFMRRGAVIVRSSLPSAHVKSAEHHREKEYADFVSRADELRGDYQFFHTLGASFVPNKVVALVAPAMRLYKSFDEGFNDAQDLSVEGLKKFLEEKSVPLVPEMNIDPASHSFLLKFFITVATKGFCAPGLEG